MSTTDQKTQDKKQELLEKQKLLKTIREWVGNNKKLFWKYEVSAFYKTYVIRMGNLPKPSAEDIVVSSNNRLLNSQQKSQLSSAIAKACAGAEVLSNSSFDIQIDYDHGVVIAEIVKSGKNPRYVYY